MSGLMRGVVMGLAILAVLLISGGATAYVMLRGAGTFDPVKLRPLVLTPEEQTWLAERHARPAEPAERTSAPSPDGEELLQHIAEMASAERAASLIGQLKRQKQSHDEQKAFLDQRDAELKLAQADLIRLQKTVETRERALEDERRRLGEEQARWAVARIEEAGRVQAMDEVEKARYRDQAKLFEQMKDAAWQSLRRFEARDIARYLALMDGKKAARLLTLAQQDIEQPSLASAIHREMLRIDLDGKTGDHIERLAKLYAFMPADQVMPYLRGSSAQEIADLLTAMARDGNVKKRADLMEALRREDSRREMQVRSILEAAKPAEAAQ